MNNLVFYADGILIHQGRDLDHWDWIILRDLSDNCHNVISAVIADFAIYGNITASES